MELTNEYRFVYNHIAPKREHYYSYEEYKTLCDVKLRMVPQSAVHNERDGREVCYRCLLRWKYLQKKEANNENL